MPLARTIVLDVPQSPPLWHEACYKLRIMVSTPKISLQTLRDEYEELFSTAEILPAKKAMVEDSARQIAAEKERYKVIQAATGVPWYIIGCIHMLEGSLNFKRHLHNGDPLTARTVHVPKNRPVNGTPPFSFEQSAIDALQYDGIAQWDDWSTAGMLYKLEGYNGFGYRLCHSNVKTPYLWSCTNHYTQGKYGADGKFDANLVSQQTGIAALLRALEDLDLLESDGRARALSFVAGGVETPPYPGRVIRRGDPDRATVKQIQEQLVAIGCGPLVPDGVFGSGTESAVRLFQSRRDDGHGRPLDMDGKIGPSSWAALFGEPAVATTEPNEVCDPLVIKALVIAESQEGVREKPANSNLGPEVETYQRTAGVTPPTPWCAAFVYWSFERAAAELGLDNPLVRTGGVMDHWGQARSRGIRSITARQVEEDPSLVQPGQIFFMDHGNGKGHAGLVKRVSGDLITTIEGNTNSAGAREGDGVYLRKRKLSDINAGFLDYSKPRRIEDGEPEVEPAANLPDITPLVLTTSSGGWLRKAVEQRAFETPVWIEVPFRGHIIKVGAHALRAKAGGRLLRLPVSYQDVVAICRTLEWLPPTAALSDAIYRAATVQVKPAPQGKWGTPAQDKITSAKMRTLEFVVSHDEAIEKQIPAKRRNDLASTEGKDWILSNRNIRAPQAATTYGWHNPDKNGWPIQGLGSDWDAPAHDSGHFDYSQTLRPIQRKVKRVMDGAEVDLLNVLAEGLRDDVLEPFRIA